MRLSTEISLCSPCWFRQLETPLNDQFSYNAIDVGEMKVVTQCESNLFWVLKVFRCMSVPLCFTINAFPITKQNIQYMADFMFASSQWETVLLCIDVFRWLGASLESAIQYIKNNAWVTVNNDFLVTSEVICQWFSRVTKSRVKIIGKSPHEWPKHRYSR